MYYQVLADIADTYLDADSDYSHIAEEVNERLVDNSAIFTKIVPFNFTMFLVSLQDRDNLADFRLLF